MTVEVTYLRRVGKKRSRHMRAIFSVRLNETPSTGLTLRCLYLMGDDKAGWWLGCPGQKSDAVFEPYITFSRDLRDAIVEAALGKYRGSR